MNEQTARCNSGKVNKQARLLLLLIDKHAMALRAREGLGRLYDLVMRLVADHWRNGDVTVPRRPRPGVVRAGRVNRARNQRGSASLGK